MERWYPDELEMAGPEHLNAEFVAGYDRKQQFDPSADVALLAELGIGRDATIVDLGAGTGTFAVAAARAVGTVVAVDISPVMVDVLRRQRAGVRCRQRDRRRSRAPELLARGQSAGRRVLPQRAAPPPRLLERRRAAAHRRGPASERACSSSATSSTTSSPHPRPRGSASGSPAQPTIPRSATPPRISSSISSPSTAPTAGSLDSLLESAGFRIIDVQFRKSVYASYTCAVGG